MVKENFKVLSLQDYAGLIGEEAVNRIREKALKLKDHHIVHVNSTHYGGGVAEMLLSLTLLMNDVGIKTGWRVIRGVPDFFNITKKMHNALQGGEINLSEETKQVYEQVVYENSIRTHLDTHDYVVIHDPQPLPIIQHYERQGKWIWRCHLDLSEPNQGLWKYLEGFIKQYDSTIFTLPEYSQNIDVPKNYFMPAIDPLSIKNLPLQEDLMMAKLREYKIPLDKPLVCQVSRFDRWKDPKGVIKAAEIARKEVDFTLVLLGNAATDDPEGTEVFESLLSKRDDRTLILSYGDDTFLVNTLQRKSDIVLQKSIREGFGLTVTEAMWKETPVIGGRVGGIPSQIDDGVNGYLVASPEEAAQRMVELLKNESLRKDMGIKARQKVRENFLLSRLLEQYIDMFNSF